MHTHTRSSSENQGGRIKNERKGSRGDERRNPQDGVKAVDVVQDIIDDAIDIESSKETKKTEQKTGYATVPVIEAIEKSLYKTQSPESAEEVFASVSEKSTSTYKI
jgi:fructose-specific phosphotransferase system component IIB